MGGRRRHYAVSIAPAGALAFLDRKIARRQFPRKGISDWPLASPDVVAKALSPHLWKEKEKEKNKS
jgi:hypothetical protein